MAIVGVETVEPDDDTTVVCLSSVSVSLVAGILHCSLKTKP